LCSVHHGPLKNFSSISFLFANKKKTLFFSFLFLFSFQSRLIFGVIWSLATATMTFNNTPTCSDMWSRFHVSVASIQGDQMSLVKNAQNGAQTVFLSK
jgi:hypothetical protein